MLNITRRRGERIVVGDDIFVSVLEVSGQTVRLGIDAPRSVRVYREEIWLEVKAQNEAAAAAAGRAPSSRANLPTGKRPRRARRGALGDEAEQLLVGLQLRAQGLEDLRVQLADAALGHAEDLADLAQRQVVDVEQHGDLALARGQAVECLAEALLGGDRSSPSSSGSESRSSAASVSIRSIAASSSECTSALSEPICERAQLVLAAVELLEVTPMRGAQLVA